MRTMLISLVCFFFLSQLAIAQTPLSNPLDIKEWKCGITFECYAPEICTNGDLDGKPISDGSVVQVQKNTPISNDCPALFRFHQYTESKVHVEIESFLPINDINDIIFEQKDNHGNLKSKFSCTYDSSTGKIKGKYLDAEKYDTDTIPEKLKCSFDASKKKKLGPIRARYNLVFNGESYDMIKITTNKGSIETELIINDKPYCDTSLLNFEEEISSTRVFDEVLHKHGDFYCGTEHYKMEYRLNKTDVWKLVTNNEIGCKYMRYKINGDLIAYKTNIEMRCFIKASFLCNYNVKWNNEQKEPEFTNSDPSIQRETSLVCPSDHPHLIIFGHDGKRDQIPNAKFECKNYGIDQLWTVNNERFTKEGPPVYCTKELKCHLIKTISETAVERGYLGGDLSPTCFEQGELKVDHKQVKVQCDTSTGHYQYKHDGGVWTPVDENTKFHCDYPTLIDTEKDAEQSIRTDAYVAGGVAVLIGLGFIVGCVICFFRTIAKKNRNIKKAQIEMQNDFMKYAATKEDEAADKRDKKQKERMMSKVCRAL